MLTKQCKEILSLLKLLTNNSDAEFSYLANTNCFCLSRDIECTRDYSAYASEIFSIMEQLLNEGYVKNTFNPYHFRLTQKSIHHKQFICRAILNYLCDKWISLIALIVSILALLKSYGYGIDDIFISCMQLLRK